MISQLLACFEMSFTGQFSFRYKLNDPVASHNQRKFDAGSAECT